MRLFNRGYKVVFKFPYGRDAKIASVSLALYGVKAKMIKDQPYDHRIKCWFKDYDEFKIWTKAILKSCIEIGIV